MSRPLVCGLYAAVVDAAKDWCDCRDGEPSGCGSTAHFLGGRSCWRRGTETDRDSPLIVAPRDPDLPDHLAAGLGAEDLMALCRYCWTRRRNLARKARAARIQQELEQAQNALFGL